MKELSILEDGIIFAVNKYSTIEILSSLYFMSKSNIGIYEFIMAKK